ncbi:cytochrome b/b6 domain-containing protein [soil metagenome]
MASVTAAPAEPAGRVLIKRHSALVRITHWINALAIIFLVLSGLQIFNAHPALYIGQKADFDNPVLSMSAFRLSDGRVVGETKILGAKFDTTGVLGLSSGPDGQPVARGFPSWATVPSYQDLATGRRWHFFFVWLFAINGAIYLAVSLANRHVWRDLIPSGAQLRGIGRSILDHLRLRFDHGRDYNVLQKVTYLIVIFVLLPLIVLTGMTMSPGLNAAFPWLVDLFGGRQTARTIHFICATGIVLFIVVHLVMVLISGVWNNLRSMITGRYAVTTGSDSHG